jgi:hypothetical protein
MWSLTAPRAGMGAFAGGEARGYVRPMIRYAARTSIACMAVACSPDPSSPIDQDETDSTSESGSDDNADTTTGEEPVEVPEASRCMDYDESNNCIEMAAWPWADDHHYVWRQGLDITKSVIERVPAAGEPTLVADLSSHNWHTLGGLAVAPDGTLWISGASLDGTDQPLVVDEVPIDLEFQYIWFVVHLDAEGLVLDHETFRTETAARVMLAARADGSVFLVGDLFAVEQIAFGDLTLEPSVNGDIVIARLDDHAQPLWAHQRQPVEFGSLLLVDMVQSPDGLAIVAALTAAIRTRPRPAAASRSSRRRWC